MPLGLTLIMIAGLLWVFGAIVIRNAIGHKLNAFFIMAFPALVAAVCCLPVMMFLSVPDCDNQTHFAVFLSLFIAGGFSIVSLLAMERIRLYGKTCFIQHAGHVTFVFPFLMSILVFGERLSMARFLGLILLGAAAIMLGSIFPTKRIKPTPDKNWKIIALIGFFGSGLSQCAFLLPSFITDAEEVGSTLRMFYFCCGVVVGAAGLMARQPSLLESRKCFIPSMLISFILIISCGFLTFRGFNALANAGYGAVAFPFALACTMSGIYLYRRYLLKEEIRMIQTIGFSLGLLGLVMILL